MEMKARTMTPSTVRPMPPTPPPRLVPPRKMAESTVISSPAPLSDCADMARDESTIAAIAVNSAEAM